MSRGSRFTMVFNPTVSLRNRLKTILIAILPRPLWVEHLAIHGNINARGQTLDRANGGADVEHGICRAKPRRLH